PLLLRFPPKKCWKVFVSNTIRTCDAHIAKTSEKPPQCIYIFYNSLQIRFPSLPLSITDSLRT
ncbi:MAG: hypothetical protein U1C33_01070, partial [Candidatus Cloacimonadaceae bacterium]|nr:hypothetical protein [Candidatus Cloacimonadaceae bacterium]